MRTTITNMVLLAFAACGLTGAHCFAAERYDVVVYGGTSAGVTAAIQVSRMHHSVVLIEPGRHVGGLTAGGLGATDIGNKAAIGGSSRNFYRRVARYYAQDKAWRFESPRDLRGSRRRSNEAEMWVFEPHVAEQILNDMLAEAKVPVLLRERLDLNGGVHKEGGRIVSLHTESGRVFEGRVFIDATYEGDVMAKAGVSYHVGREANATYGETLNGVQVEEAVSHQFIVPVDPYVVAGNAASGLLPHIEPRPPGPDGSGDRRIQAYCFRICTTDVPQNRIPWPKPADYDPRRYELLLRNFEAGDHRIPWNPIFLPNRKTDTNNNYAVSIDNIGMSDDYPEGNYATRARIIAEQESYQKGLLWTLANSARVPPKIRQLFQRFGLAADEFVDNGHWPHQIYVREARRMISDYVMAQHDCQGRRVPEDSVGLAAYTMDSHHVERYVRDGRVWNEGDVQVGGFSPYPIAYRAIRPKKSECTNLLVPACPSSTHIAFGSIRMEPVFMVLGQSAATAAVLALESGSSVQDVDVRKLQKRLRDDGQILEWTGPKTLSAIDPHALPGIVIDDRRATPIGAWQRSAAIRPFVGVGYLHDGNANKGKLRCTFAVSIPTTGEYEVRVSVCPSPNRATNVPVVVETADGVKTVHVNERERPATPPFVSIGRFRFEQGRPASVTISNASTDGYVVADAIQLLPLHGR
jgi:glycine/D-amino acid oxidase-like deaminating enzyme